jgi:hypothetical protein
MDILLTPLNEFAQHVDLGHVLVLNLIGWWVKCALHHTGNQRWTDIIPILLGVVGIALAYKDPNPGLDHPTIQGLADAGLAWLFHQGVKKAQKVDVQEVKDFTTQKMKTLTGRGGTGDGTKK